MFTCVETWVTNLESRRNLSLWMGCGRNNLIKVPDALKRRRLWWPRQLRFNFTALLESSAAGDGVQAHTSWSVMLWVWIWHFRAFDPHWDAWWSLNMWSTYDITHGNGLDWILLISHVSTGLQHMYSGAGTCHSATQEEMFAIWDTLHAWNGFYTSSTHFSVICIAVVCLLCFF